VRADPRSHRDWEWVAVPLRLPPTVPPGAVLHLPTVRVVNGAVRAEVAFTHAVPKPGRDGHVVALGIDWGLNTLLSAGAARLHPDRTITVLGSGAAYRAVGVLAKAHRLRRQAEQLAAKACRYEQLTAGSDAHPLNGRLAVLREEHRRVSQRRSGLNSALAWSAARWAVDQAIAAGATVIYCEDLRSLEARGMGRTMNTRLSEAVRGQIVQRMRHLATEHGIAVVTVPARGTSRNCPRCLAPLRHRKAPDQPAVPGWKWVGHPGKALRPRRPASGGTRHNGPAATPESGTPEPGRDNGQPDSQPPPPPGTRGRTRRRVPPRRPRHPATMGT
jgi:hypothetical protein